MSEQPLVLLLHGPNLNLLGQREPDVYGTATLDDHVANATKAAATLSLAVESFQTNHEGEMVDAIHGARGRCAAIVINPGAFTHYAWSIHDALAAFAGPVIEVHLSNPNAREPWRHTSVVSPVAAGSIVGLGGHGYELALEAVARLIAKGPPQDERRGTGEASASSSKAEADGKTGDPTGLSKADNAAGGVDGRQERPTHSAVDPKEHA